MSSDAGASAVLLMVLALLALTVSLLGLLVGADAGPAGHLGNVVALAFGLAALVASTLAAAEVLGG